MLTSWNNLVPYPFLKKRMTTGMTMIKKTENTAMMKLTKQNYVERDISWMHFNHRILEEAQREDVPVLERMSFLGIYSNNLDEFFRVRMANLGRVAALADDHPTREVKTEAEKAAQQLKVINRLNALEWQEGDGHHRAAGTL